MERRSTFQIIMELISVGIICAGLLIAGTETSPAPELSIEAEHAPYYTVPE
jgi:hypothetical protein